MSAKTSNAIQQKIEEGIAFHREGKWDAAEVIYREVLKKDARNIDALHLLGNIAMQRGEYEQAEKWVRKALKELKAFPLALLTLAQIKTRTGRHGEAEKSLKEALRIQPTFFDAHLTLARLYTSLGRQQEALKHYRECVKEVPGSPIARLEMANTQVACGEYLEAEAVYRELVQSDPDFLDGVNNYAVFLLNQKREDEAESVLKALLERHPTFAMGWSNLGLTYENRQAYAEALAHYQRACEVDPSFSSARYNMGNVYLKMNDLVRARSCYEETLKAQPDYMHAHNALARLAMMDGQGEDAESCLKRSIALEPVDNYFAYSTYATLLRDQQRFDESVAMCLKAIEADPANADAYNTLGWAYNDLGNYAEAERAFRKGLEVDPHSRKLHSNLLMLLTYRMELDHESLHREHARYGEQHGPEHADELRGLGVALTPYRRLRIGYLSPDFKRHVVRNFIQPVIGAHDRQKVEVFCYGEIEKPDDVTAQIQELTDHWINTHGLSALEVANRIREDRIDVLIELAGHSGNNRLDVVDYHPAPVQVSYLGYITTTGARGMDYRITDPIMNPPDSPERFTEELYRLDRCYKVYEPAPHEPPVNPVVAPAGKVVFGSLHRISKLTDRTVALWAAVMRAVPEATLLLARHELHFAENRKSVLAIFERHGVPAERIVLDDTYGYKTHMEIYRKIDIGLDPIPVVGGATTAEAMWMGVPVLTLQGEAFRERISSTLLDAVGLAEWIATSSEDYVARAVRFANDYHYRLQLRANIRHMFKNSPLGDAEGLASALEDAYLDMWHRQLEKQAHQASGMES